MVNKTAIKSFWMCHFYHSIENWVGLHETNFISHTSIWYLIISPCGPLQELCKIMTIANILFSVMIFEKFFTVYKLNFKQFFRLFNLDFLNWPITMRTIDFESVVFLSNLFAFCIIMVSEVFFTIFALWPWQEKSWFRKNIVQVGIEVQCSNSFSADSSPDRCYHKKSIEPS
jgi:hypothetical protein